MLGVLIQTMFALQDGEFLWSKRTQGLILGSFFWGYLLTQLPGGWLASRFGGKRVLGYCMCACSLLTLLMPLAARTDYRFLLALRILAGICQVSVGLLGLIRPVPLHHCLF